MRSFRAVQKFHAKAAAYPILAIGTGYAAALAPLRLLVSGQAMIIQGCSIRLVSAWRNFAARAPSTTRWSTDKVYLSR